MLSGRVRSAEEPGGHRVAHLFSLSCRAVWLFLLPSMADIDGRDHDHSIYVGHILTHIYQRPYVLNQDRMQDAGEPGGGGFRGVGGTGVASGDVEVGADKQHAAVGDLA